MRSPLSSSLVLSAAFVLPVATCAQGLGADAPALTVQQIAERLAAANARRDAALGSYSSRRVMTVQFQTSLGAGQAAETVQMNYTPPGTKTFAVLSVDGPQFIRDAVLQREMDSEAAAAKPEARQQAALTAANYNMRLVGEQQRAAGNCYVLEVSPRTQSPYAFIGKVWVQAADFAVVRIEGRPAQGVSVWVTGGQFTTTYGKVGAFYFPELTQSTSQIRLGGDASLTIRYGPYTLGGAAAAQR